MRPSVALLLRTTSVIALMAGGMTAVPAGSAHAQTAITSGTTAISTAGDTTRYNISGTATLSVGTGAGLLQSGGNAPVTWNGTTSGTGITITNAGTIQNTSTGRAFDSSGSASGRDLVFTNQANALISAAAQDAVRINTNITSGSVTFTNAGTIRAASATASTTLFGQALDLRTMNTSGVTLAITNTGTGLIEALNDDAVRPGLNATIDNSGTIRSSGANTSGGANGTADAIDAGARTGVLVTNRSGGTISGARHGITADTDIRVVNEGTITGRNGSGVGSDGSGTVTNRGIITGAYAGLGNIYNSDATASTNGDGDGVDIDLLGVVENYGVIEGTGAGGVDSGGRANNSEGLAMGGGTLTNHAGATVVGATRGILIDDGAAGSAYGATTITNNGTIEGKAGPAITLIGTFADTITNGGMIIGVGTAIDMGAGNDTLTVTGGSITGDVAGGDGTDALAFTLGSGGSFTTGGSFTGFETVTVNSGTVAANGTLAGAITVGSSGIIKGSGTLGSLVNQGRVAPGNSIGTLTVSGDFTNAAQSTLAIEIDAAGNTDLLRVTGKATLSGGTVEVNGAAGSYTQGQSYTFLTATGGVTGQFAGVTSNFTALGYPFLTPALSYAANSVAFSLARSSTSYESVTTNSEQAAVARALDQAGTTTGTLNTLTTEVNRLSAAQARAAFESLNPETVSNASVVAGVSTGQVTNLAFQRLEQASGRSGPSMVAGLAGGDSASFPLMFAGGSGRVQDQPLYAAVPASGPAGVSPWGGWARGYHIRGTVDAMDSLDGLDFRTTGFAIGLDRQINNNLVVGLTGGYAQTDLDFDGRATDDLDVRSAQLGVYGGWTAGPVFAKAAAVFGVNLADSQRQVTVGALTGTPKAEYAGREINATLESGYRFEAAGFGVAPSVGFQLGYAWQQEYTEEGLGAVVVGEISDLTLRPSIGVAVDRTLAAGAFQVIPQVQARYARDLAAGAQDVTARFVGASAGSLTVPGRDTGRDIISFGAGVSVDHGALSAFADYAGEWRVDQTAHAVIAGVRYRW